MSSRETPGGLLVKAVYLWFDTASLSPFPDPADSPSASRSNMMTKKFVVSILAVTLVSLSGLAYAQLGFGTDYTTSDAVFVVVNVKVDSNMMDFYLEGIKQTWVTGNEAAMELGQLDSYSIYINEFQDSGAYNLTLVTRFADLAQYDKGRKEFAQFEELWLSKIPEQQRREIVADYPGMRTITGEYLMREVTLQ